MIYRISLWLLLQIIPISSQVLLPILLIESVMSSIAPHCFFVDYSMLFRVTPFMLLLFNKDLYTRRVKKNSFNLSWYSSSACKFL